MTKDEIAKHVFARNPKTDEVFITSDGQAFQEESQANSHAQRLSERKVEHFNRVAGEVDKALSATPEVVEKPELTETTEVVEKPKTKPKK